MPFGEQDCLVNNSFFFQLTALFSRGRLIAWSCTSMSLQNSYLLLCGKFNSISRNLVHIFAHNCLEGTRRAGLSTQSVWKEPKNVFAKVFGRNYSLSLLHTKILFGKNPWATYGFISNNFPHSCLVRKIILILLKLLHGT